MGRNNRGGRQVEWKAVDCEKWEGITEEDDKWKEKAVDREK